MKRYIIQVTQKVPLNNLRALTLDRKRKNWGSCRDKGNKENSRLSYMER